MANWRDKYMAYTCHRCMSKPGEPCRSTLGNVTTHIHKSRIMQWRYDQKLLRKQRLAGG